jgi:hypothetical protein
MTSKRGPTSDSPFFNQRAEADSPSTLRSIEVAEEIAADTEVQPAPVYYEPQPLPAISDHKTIEVETIKLADDIDPRKLPTELRLARPPSVAAPDSGWPQTDVVVVSSQPPQAPRRRWRAPLALLILFGALVVLVLARGAAQRAHAAAQAASAAALADTSVPTEVAATLSPAPSPVSTVAVPAVPESAAPEAAPPVPEPKPQKHAGRQRNPVKSSARPTSDSESSASSRVLAAPSPSKPKRAIY